MVGCCSTRMGANMTVDEYWTSEMMAVGATNYKRESLFYALAERAWNAAWRAAKKSEQAAWRAGLDAGREQGRRNEHAHQPTGAPVGVEWPLSLLRAGHWREVHIGRRYMRLEITYDFATWKRLMAEVESALAQQPSACPMCDGTGEADSGGIMPWGAPAMIPCECQQPAAVDVNEPRPGAGKAVRT